MHGSYGYRDLSITRLSILRLKHTPQIIRLRQGIYTALNNKTLNSEIETFINLAESKSPSEPLSITRLSILRLKHGYGNRRIKMASGEGLSITRLSILRLKLCSRRFASRELAWGPLNNKTLNSEIETSHLHALHAASL